MLAALMALLLVFGASCNSNARSTSDPGALPSEGQAQLTTVADVQLPGDTSRWDYQAIDPQSHRLFIAHLGAGELVVFDTQKGAVIDTVRGLKGVHGVIAAPELRRVYASATDVQQIAVIDADSLAVITMIPSKGYPDGLAYAPDVGKIYVSDEKDGNETVIDARTNTALGVVAVGGEAGNTQYDSASHHIFVAVQTRNQLVEIDPATDQVVQRFDLPGCEHPHGLLIYSEQRRAFVACQGNNKLIVMDMPTMKVSSIQDVGNGPDVLAVDSQLHIVYVAAENGPLAVFASDANGVTRIAFQSAGPNAHSVAVAPDTHHVFLPLTNVNGHPTLREMALQLPPSN
jgi:DNA-binding beta-propeller fold protein YncE